MAAGPSMTQGTERVRDAKRSGDIAELCSIATDTDLRGPWRKAAIKALRKEGNPRVVEDLAPLTHDPDRTCRAAAIKAIVKIGGKHAPAALIGALSSDLRTAVQAADALGEMGDKKAVKPLISRIDHLEWKLRRSAARALSRIGEPEGLTAIAAQAEREMGTKARVMRRFAKPSEKR